MLRCWTVKCMRLRGARHFTNRHGEAGSFEVGKELVGCLLVVRHQGAVRAVVRCLDVLDRVGQAQPGDDRRQLLGGLPPRVDGVVVEGHHPTDVIELLIEPVDAAAVRYGLVLHKGVILLAKAVDLTRFGREHCVVL